MTESERKVVAGLRNAILKRDWDAISDVGIGEDDSVRFRVDIRGLTRSIQRVAGAFFAREEANATGEALVRKHLGHFLTVLGGSPPRAKRYAHKSFGMKLVSREDCLLFTFQPDLFDRLLKEEILGAEGRAAQPDQAPGTSARNGPQKAFQDWIRNLPGLSPREMFDAIAAAGYVGQEQARKAICLLAYRHLRRIQAVYIDGKPPNDLPAKENLLLLGPTGCGKTFLVELLFQDVLKLPATVVDMTGFTETG